jgi:transcriptional regulator with XRE-family HTH domain
MERKHKKSGKVFKKLRKERKINASEIVTKEGCSKKTLHNFENHNSNMEINTFLDCLEIIEVSFEKFDKAVWGYQPQLNPKNTFLKNLVSAYKYENVLDLKILLNEKKSAKILTEEDKICILLISDHIRDLAPSFPIAQEYLQIAIDYFLLLILGKRLN